MFQNYDTTTSIVNMSASVYVLDLELLGLRRLRFDLKYYDKALNYLTQFNPCDLRIYYLRACGSLQIRAILSTETSQSHNQTFVNFFLYRNIDAWNGLHSALRSSTILPAF
jgi:hypothetical protein